MSEILNPLQQRLFLYRFAVVQIAPGSTASPGGWGLPGLQWLNPFRNRHNWRSMFPECLPFSNLTGYPVASPSLPALCRLRLRQPRRPLVFLQTAFEPLRRNPQLKGLIRPAHSVTKILAPEDPIQPLFWLDGRPDRNVTLLECYREMGNHPREEYMRKIERRNPGLLILVREDGELLLQPNLFDPFNRGKNPLSYERRIHGFDQRLGKTLAALRGRFFVFSKKRERLEWFRRDGLRALGIRACFWRYPTQPDPRDPLTHFILVQDSKIRFQRLNPRIPQLHLDGDSRTLRYRTVRSQTLGSGDWFSPKPPEAFARFEVEHRCLTFAFGEDGWRSHACDTKNAPDKTGLFRQRLYLFR